MESLTHAQVLSGVPGCSISLLHCLYGIRRDLNRRPTLLEHNEHEEVSGNMRKVVMRKVVIRKVTRARKLRSNASTPPLSDCCRAARGIGSLRAPITDRMGNCKTGFTFKGVPVQE